MENPTQRFVRSVLRFPSTNAPTTLHTLHRRKSLVQCFVPHCTRHGIRPDMISKRSGALPKLMTLATRPLATVNGENMFLWTWVGKEGLEVSKSSSGYRRLKQANDSLECCGMRVMPSDLASFRLNGHAKNVIKPPMNWPRLSAVLFGTVLWDHQNQQTKRLRSLGFKCFLFPD